MESPPVQITSGLGCQRSTTLTTTLRPRALSCNLAEGMPCKIKQNRCAFNADSLPLRSSATRHSPKQNTETKKTDRS